jgi:hypothetical protein
MNKVIVLCSACLLLLAGVPLTVGAAPITYSFSGTGSGFVGATQFINTDFLILLDGDTDSIAFSNNIAQNFIGIGDGTISLAGIGAGTFTEFLWMFNNKTAEGVGFRGLPIVPEIPDFLSINSFGTGLDSYDLDTAFGPLPQPNFPFVSPGNSLGLDIGALSFNNVSGTTFEAYLVPVPGAVWLFGSALGLLGWVRHKKA